VYFSFFYSSSRSERISNHHVNGNLWQLLNEIFYRSDVLITAASTSEAMALWRYTNLIIIIIIISIGRITEENIWSSLDFLDEDSPKRMQFLQVHINGSSQHGSEPVIMEAHGYE